MSGLEIKIARQKHVLILMYPNTFVISSAIIRCNRRSYEDQQGTVSLLITKFSDREEFAVSFQYLYRLSKKLFESLKIAVSEDDVLKYFEENYAHFNFDQPRDIQFQNFKGPQFFIYDYGYNLQPQLAIYNAALAAKIIQQIKNNHLQTLKVIAEYKNSNYFPKISNEQVESLKYFKNNACDRFKGMFDFLAAPHSSYNAQIFDQQRFIDGSLNQERQFIYFLTSTTSQIFNLSEKMNRKMLYFYGQSGIGKSAALSLLVNIHNYIDFMRMGISQSSFSKYEGSISWQEMRTFPKYFYFSLRPITSKFPSNQQRFLDIIKRQLPQSLRFEDISHRKYLQQIQAYYQAMQVPVIYIIDQINIYYSLIRDSISMKYRKQRTNSIDYEIKDITNLLKDLSRYKVILGSLQSPQTFIKQNQYQQFQFQQYCREIVKIQYGLNCRTFDGLKSMMSLILFENLNQVIKHNIIIDRHLQVYIGDLKDKEISLLLSFDDLDEKRKQQFFFLSDLTHQTIKQCYDRNQQLILRPKQVDKMNIDLFRHFCIKFHESMIQFQSSRYSKFINKGDQCFRYLKYNEIMRMRVTAFNIIQEGQHKTSFSYVLNEQVNDAMKQCELYKQHAEVIGNQLIIHYAPETFYKMTKSIKQDGNFLQRFIRQALNDNHFSQKLVGQIFRSYLTKLLSSNHIIFFLRQGFMIYYTQQILGFHAFTNILTQQIALYKNKHNQSYPNHNQHFDDLMELIKTEKDTQVTKQTSVYTRFYELFKKINSVDHPQYKQHQNELYLCALPIKDSQYHATTREVIDFLLIRKQFMRQDNKQCYLLRTYDLTVSTSNEDINEKIKKAQLFFAKFIKVVKEQNSKHKSQLFLLDQTSEPMMPYKFRKIIHTFILPRDSQPMNHIQMTIEDNTSFQILFCPLEAIKFMPRTNIPLDDSAVIFVTQIINKIKHDKEMGY